MATRREMSNPERLPSRSEEGDLHVVIDTPKGSHNKYKWDEELAAFRLARVMPAGMAFPFDFGFIPRTRAEDGDALDVLVLMDAPAFPGCVVPCRLIGVIEATQTERGGETERNDRMVAVASASKTHDGVESFSAISANLLKEIEEFFRNYNQQSGKQFKVLGRKGAKLAERQVSAGRRAFTNTEK